MLLDCWSFYNGLLIVFYDELLVVFWQVFLPSDSTILCTTTRPAEVDRQERERFLFWSLAHMSGQHFSCARSRCTYLNDLFRSDFCPVRGAHVWMAFSSFRDLGLNTRIWTTFIFLFPVIHGLTIPLLPEIWMCTSKHHCSLDVAVRLIVPPSMERLVDIWTTFIFPPVIHEFLTAFFILDLDVHIRTSLSSRCCGAIDRFPFDETVDRPHSSRCYEAADRFRR